MVKAGQEENDIATRRRPFRPASSRVSETRAAFRLFSEKANKTNKFVLIVLPIISAARSTGFPKPLPLSWQRNGLRARFVYCNGLGYFSETQRFLRTIFGAEMR